MKNTLASLFITGLLLAGPAHAQDDPRIATGEAAASAWLGLVDSGDFGKSWEQTSALFQTNVPRPRWMTAIAKAREPLGKLKSRTAASARFADSLPGAPDGEYVSIQYQSEFENKKDAVETVTTQHEKDGSWKVSGYFIK